MPTPLKAFSLRLVAARKSAGLSTWALARKAEITTSTLSRIEAGRVDPKLSTILKLAEALGCKPCDLVSHQKEQP